MIDLIKTAEQPRGVRRRTASRRSASALQDGFGVVMRRRRQAKLPQRMHVKAVGTATGVATFPSNPTANMSKTRIHTQCQGSHLSSARAHGTYSTYPRSSSSSCWRVCREARGAVKCEDSRKVIGTRRDINRIYNGFYFFFFDLHSMIDASWRAKHAVSP